MTYISSFFQNPNLIYDFISLILEITLGLIFLWQVLAPKSLSIVSLVLFIFFYFFCLMIQEFIHLTTSFDTYGLFVLFHFLCLYLFACKFCNGLQPFRIYLTLAYTTIITLRNFPVELITNSLSSLYPSISYHFMINKLLSCFILLPCTYFFIHYKIDTTVKSPSSISLTMIFASILNISILPLLKGDSKYIHNLNLIATMLLILELMIYYMIWQFTMEYSNRVRLELMNHQQTYQFEHMEDIKTIVNEYHRLRHDFKNHILCMDQMLSEQKYNELKSYFYPLRQNIYSVDNQIETGNLIANQVINIKYATTSRLNIPLHIHSELPSQLNIPDYLFCSLLSNLLDNAIEASIQTDKPDIDVSLSIIKNYLSITIKNHISLAQIEAAKVKKTTKKNPNQHGLGLKIVQSIIEQYNGISIMEVQDSYFVASVMLDLETISS